MFLSVYVCLPVPIAVHTAYHTHVYETSNIGRVFSLVDFLEMPNYHFGNLIKFPHYTVYPCSYMCVWSCLLNCVCLELVGCGIHLGILKMK